STDFLVARPDIAEAYVLATAAAGRGLAGMGTGRTDVLATGADGRGRPSAPAAELRVVYTAMHGVGTRILLDVFETAGLPEPILVEAQAEPDPDFPTVEFPNPEEPGALDLAIATARAGDADLILANDPDADRLAVAVPDPASEGGWRRLTGNELGALIADHLLRRGAHQPDDALVTTVVSSRLLSRLAAAAGVAYF